jgi:hypothetical protein
MHGRPSERFQGRGLRWESCRRSKSSSSTSESTRSAVPAVPVVEIEGREAPNGIFSRHGIFDEHALMQGHATRVLPRPLASPLKKLTKVTNAGRVIHSKSYTIYSTLNCIRKNTPVRLSQFTLALSASRARCCCCSACRPNSPSLSSLGPSSPPGSMLQGD